jgi:predicted membrane protein
MEFEEIKKIWDMQNNETLYAINETALYSRILSKKRSAGHIANFSELLIIFANVGTGLLVLGMALSRSSVNIFTYLLSAWAIATAVYVLVSRIRRKKNENRFDRSMLGDLRHAISNASYQVWLSGVMIWNVVPIVILILLDFWKSEKLSVWVAIFMPVFSVIVFYASRWEHGIYKKRKRELEGLQQKLESEEINGSLS